MNDNQQLSHLLFSVSFKILSLCLHMVYSTVYPRQASSKYTFAPCQQVLLVKTQTLYLSRLNSDEFLSNIFINVYIF